MWVFIPLKDFVKAKQRLSGFLSPSERRCLFQAMVEDVLDVLTQVSSLERIILLSDDPAATLLAEHYGIDCWSEKALGATGLNPVINAAVNSVVGQVDAAMVVHGDLPLATQEEWEEVLAVHRQIVNPNKLTLVTDRHCDGSNVVVCSPPGALAYEYGPESCHHHRQQAQDNGLVVEILELQGLSRDVDDGDDLLELLNRDWGRRGPKTLQYLRENKLDLRIKALMTRETNSAFIKMNAVHN
ncbi:2-phospho-L-lactate guanylyltransferase [Litorivivens sp.]|uniref:2-phospho-L-lactate guanylyltransferase n=1 Tax=Litorivivens sp. TaxID=2020868 RepID=UPI0035690AE4